MYYKNISYLTTDIGNNALSFEERRLLGSACKLTIPALKKGTLDDIQIGTDIVFEEVNHKGELKSCVGLENLIELESNCTLKNWNGKLIPTFIVDNHNHALYLRYREYLSKRLGAGATLIHIDQHADMGIPSTSIDTAKCSNIEYISWYTNEVCNVGNFIQPAVDSGLIKEVIQVRSVSKLLETTIPSSSDRSLILDIDIDFRVDHHPTPEEIDAVHRLYKGASVCTIALSPYFMPIEKSIEVVKMLFT